MKSSYDAILRRKGSKVTCPICNKSCEGGAKYLETGELIGGDSRDADIMMDGHLINKKKR